MGAIGLNRRRLSIAAAERPGTTKSVGARTVQKLIEPCIIKRAITIRANAIVEMIDDAILSCLYLI